MMDSENKSEKKPASKIGKVYQHIKKNIFIDIINWATELKIFKGIPGFSYHTKEAMAEGGSQEEEVIQRNRYLFDIVLL